MKAVILAGGSGERFWPLSTKSTPKQFLRLFDGMTLLRQTYERVRERFDDGDIIIVTSRGHRDLTLMELPEVPDRNIIGEPERRNTGPACMVGALLSEPDEINFILPADHRIPDRPSFWKTYDKAVRGIEDSGGLFTFGIPPTRPDTGYGYIRVGEKVADGVQDVSSFKEKPDPETAEVYLRSGVHFWNSGMFLWKAGDLLEEMKHCSPDIYDAMKGLDPMNDDQMDAIYSRVPSRSIDYAVMELSNNVRMVEGSFVWSDVGSWDSIRDLEGPTDEGDGISLLGSSDVVVRSTTGRPIGIVDLSGITVVDTPEGLLICRKGQAQKVRDIARKFK